MQRIISPSMLSADFGHLERDTQMIDRSAAEWVHIDVMDVRIPGDEGHPQGHV